MTNYERIKTMKLDELADFLEFRMLDLLNPNTCEGCPMREMCKEKDDDEYTSCVDSVKEWLYRGGLEELHVVSINDLADILGGIGHHIFDEMNCDDCPAAKECRERDAESCEQAFRFWLEAETEAEDGSPEKPEAADNDRVPPAMAFGVRFARGIEELMLEVIEPYMHGEQPTIDDEDLAAEINPHSISLPLSLSHCG